MQVTPARLTAHLLTVTGPCVRVTPTAATTLSRVERVCLLNEAHDVQRFVLAERGVVRYLPYMVSRSCSAFASRAQLLEYEAALEVCSAT